jgi:hypothetical protein
MACRACSPGDRGNDETVDTAGADTADGGIGGAC